jgi:hypothetical protein
MKKRKIIIIIIAIALLVFGLLTKVHPYDYIDLVVGGFTLGFFS